jgi:hypothetical protein
MMQNVGTIAPCPVIVRIRHNTVITPKPALVSLLCIGALSQSWPKPDTMFFCARAVCSGRGAVTATAAAGASDH